MATVELTEEEERLIRQVRDSLSKRLPQLSPAHVAQLMIAPVFQNPAYSPMKEKLVADVPVVRTGASTLCYGLDPRGAEEAVVLILRSDKDSDGNHLYGMPGGYFNAAHCGFSETGELVFCEGEQPQEGALRENAEELIRDDGKPILNLDRSRLSVMDVGVDEKPVTKGLLPVYYTIFAVALRPDEMQRVLAHSEKLRADPAYKAAVTARSMGEIADVVVLSFKEAAKITEAQFRYRHSFLSLQKLLKRPSPC